MNPAPITVDTLMDGEPVGFTSLREAINAANQAAETQLIQFSANIAGGTITLASQLPAINGGHTAYINGTGSNITVQRNAADPNKFRLFEVNLNGGLILASLKLLNGYALNDDGGAVLSFGSLTVTNCELRNNQADDNGGAIYAGRALEVHDSQINGNTAKRGGGIATGLLGTANITHSVIGLNFAKENGGGLSFNGGTATVHSVEVTGNRTGDMISGVGGGIYSAIGTVTLSGTTNIHDNQALGGLGRGGGVYVHSGTINLQDISIGNNSAWRGDGMYLAAGVTRNPAAGGVTYYGGDVEFVE